MSRDDDVSKALGTWLGKAKKVSQPPRSTETMGNLQRPEHAHAHRDEAGLVQLNFKISHATKKRIKQLAVRDNITLLVMLDRMLELYEREHGKLDRK